MRPDNMPFLNEDDVRAALTYDALLPVIRQALIDFSAGRAEQPLRTVLPVAEFGGWFAAMPAVLGDVMGAKLVTFYPGNAALGKPTHNAMIQLFRAATGEPLGVMDGRLITEMRTAAVSAVAIDHLSPAQAATLAILGSGVQARSHLEALSHLRQFSAIRVWSRTAAHAARFAEEAGAQVCQTAEDAVREADIVLALTSSPTPIVAGRWLKPTAVVCAIGAVTPERRELDSDAMRGNIVVESRDAAAREAGDILLANATIAAEIGELLAGATLMPRPGPIVFKSVGIAIEDIATARLVLEKLPLHVS